MLTPDQKNVLIADAARAFLSWFEDNFGSEHYLETDDDGKEIWISYLDHPEYKALRELV